MGSLSVWYEWTSPVDGPVSVSTEGSTFDTLLGVFTNSVLGRLGEVAWSDNFSNDLWTSQANFHAVAGTVYEIGVGGGYYFSSGRIQLSILPGAPPANDDFTNAIVLAGVATNLTANNYRATREPAEPRVWCECSSADRTVWWIWQAPADGRVTMTTEGSGFDTRLAVFTGDDLTRLSVVATNNNQGFPHLDAFYASRVNLAVRSNETYQIAVDGDPYEPEGRIRLSLHFYLPFTFDTPAAAKNLAGGFTLAGRGVEGMSYGLEVSTNIVRWDAVPDLTLTGPSLRWTDTNASLDTPQRYYRWFLK